MDKITEQDCLNALVGRVIKKIYFNTPDEQAITIETHDGLKFAISSGAHDDDDHWVDIDQVKG